MKKTIIIAALLGMMIPALAQNSSLQILLSSHIH